MSKDITIKRPLTPLEAQDIKIAKTVKEAVGVNMDKASQRVRDNYQKEVESVDPRAMFLKLKKGFIEQYGRINAADMRANDSWHLAKSNQGNIDAFNKNLANFKVEMYDKMDKFDGFDRDMNKFIEMLCKDCIEREIRPLLIEVEKKLAFQQDVFKKTIALLNKQTLPLYRRLWKRITGQS